MEVSASSFSLSALSSEWTFPRSEAMTAPLPLAVTGLVVIPVAAVAVDGFLLLLVLLVVSDRVASLD